jgi:hypothetical protein
MKSPTNLLLTAGLGAVAMYYFDPAQGRKRRDLARDRIEYGRDRLEKASYTARRAGHDVGRRADRSIHRLRAVGHEISERADAAYERARAVGHDTGHRAAGAVSSLGTLFGERHSSRAAAPMKLVGVPVLWLLVAGIGASVMYLFDPSQGLYRRARLRNRFAHRQATEHARPDAANDSDSEESRQGNARERAGNGSRAGAPEQPLPG